MDFTDARKFQNEIKSLNLKSLSKYFLLFLLSFYLFSCTDVSKSHIGEIDNVCYDDGTCDEGLKCVNGKDDKICIKLCDDISCTDKGACIVEDGKEVCKCDEGYEADGVNCLDSDECAKGDDDCSTDAICTNTQGSFTCKCKSGFEGNGVTCVNIYECFPNPCQNGGVCTDEVNGFSCTCKPGYEGNNCEINTDDCNPDPCVNGECTDEVNGYSCDCFEGYGGVNCDEEVDRCDPNPCQNGGVCTDGDTSYSCECVAGFEGDNCETNTNDCNPNPCIHGECTDGVNSYSCTCDDNYQGDNCDYCLSGFYMDTEGDCYAACDGVDEITRNNDNHNRDNSYLIPFSDGNWENTELNTKSSKDCTTTDDWYKLTVKSGEELNIAVTGSSLTLSLYKDGSEEDLGNGSLVLNKILYSAGTYYIKISTIDRPTRNYTMSITKETLCFSETNNSIDYKFCKISLSWADAVQKCREMDLYLLTIDNSAENSFILEKSTTHLSAQNSWIGLNDRGAEAGSDGSSVNWKWIRNGSHTPGYRNWGIGEPNDQSSEDCVEFYTSGDNSGTWNDQICSEERYFICK